MNRIYSINNELVDIETGEVLGEDCPDFAPESAAPETDIDALITDLEALKKQEADVRAERIKIEMQLAAIASSIAGEGKTRRVAGKLRCVKVTLRVSEKWDTAKLDEIRMSIGDKIFWEYFRIAELKPRQNEIKKLKATAGEGEKLWHRFVAALRIEPGKPGLEIER